MTILVINKLYCHTQCVWRMAIHWEDASEVRLRLHLVRYQGTEFVDGTSTIQRMNSVGESALGSHTQNSLSLIKDAWLYQHDFSQAVLPHDPPDPGLLVVVYLFV